MNRVVTDTVSKNGEVRNKVHFDLGHRLLWMEFHNRRHRADSKLPLTVEMFGKEIY